MNVRTFYRFALFMSLASGVWLLINLFFTGEAGGGPVVCPVKIVSGYPCPSCGTTRSVLSFLKGDFFLSLKTNPLGWILSVLCVPFLVILGSDLLRQKTLLFRGYLQFKSFIRRPLVAMIFTLLILSNWYWNIIKAL